MKNDLSGLHVRCADIKLHRILLECFPVKRIQLVGKLVIAKLHTKHIACFEQ